MAEQSDRQTLADLFQKSAAEHGDRPYVLTKVQSGSWEPVTYAEMWETVRQLEGRLWQMGIEHGDRVAIISNNRLEFLMVVHACHRLGAVVVPMYESQSSDDRTHIINDCKPKAVFTANAEIHDEVRARHFGADFLKWIVPFTWDRLIAELPRGVCSTVSFFQLLSVDALSLIDGRRDPKARLGDRKQVAPDDLAVLIYTSGTTGNPKGVMLSHRNIASNIEAVRQLDIITCEDRTLSFLPWAHVFGFSAELFGVTRMGASFAICESIEKIVPNLAEVQPSVLMSVPAIFSKVHAGTKAQMAKKPKPIQWLFAKGVELATRKRETGSVGLIGWVLLALANLLIFSKVRKRLGGNVRLAICGAAKLREDDGEFISALGIPVYVGYGMTETSPVATVNFPGCNRLGSSGRPVPGVTVTIDTSVTEDDKVGEIVVSGPGVMRGYYNLPDETAEAIDAEGRMRTGDIGYFDEHGFLYPVDRLGDWYKLANGKKVAPGPLEDLAKKSPLVSNVVLYGLNRDYNVALVVPNLEALKSKLNGTAPKGDTEELLKHPAAVELVLKEVQAAMEGNCKGYERVKRIALLSEEFTQKNGLLTPTLKVKRRKVIKKWQQLIDQLYA